MPAGRLCQWPIGHVLRWNVVRSVPGFSRTECQQIYSAAFDKFSTVSAFQHRFVSQARDANILCGARAIDGGSGILAEAELPCGSITENTQLRMWIDESDRWTASTDDWQSTGRFPLPTVALHEFGHSIGLSHDEDGQKNAIMDPSISNLSELQDADVREIVLRYGEDEDNGEGEKPEDDIVEMLIRCLGRLSKDDRESLRSFLSG